MTQKPLLKVARGPVFSRSNVCHVTLDVSGALAHPGISNHKDPETLVTQWCGAIDEFLRQQNIPERVHVLPQHIADQNSDLSWYISCVGVPPHLMPQLGHFIDQQLVPQMKGTRNALAQETQFEADFSRALNAARGRVGFSHADIRLGGVQSSEEMKKTSFSLAV